MSILRGKRVLLTGALGTLGRAQAMRLAEAGADLSLLDLPGRADGAELARHHGGHYLGVDLRDLVGAQAAVAEAAPDILINNAALIENAPFETVSIGSYEEQMRVNAGATFALSQAAAPAMKARGYGKIVNFCSVTLSGEWMGYAAYVASKGAILGITKALARELGSFGIRVNAMTPGAVVSEAEARIFGDRAAEYDAWVLQRQCLKARIQPEAIADAVLFLCSPQSDFMTGQELRVDGGW